MVLVLTNSQSTERIIPGLIWFACSIKKKCCFCFSAQAHGTCVGGPAYVHTCVLSGSRGTAGVLAFSLNSIFKPLYIPLENHRSTVCQACFQIGLFFLVSSYYCLLCCESHLTIWRLHMKSAELNHRKGNSQQLSVDSCSLICTINLAEMPACFH